MIDCGYAWQLRSVTVIKDIMVHFESNVSEAVGGAEPKLNFTGHTYPHPLRRALYMLVDLK